MNKLKKVCMLSACFGFTLLSSNVFATTGTATVNNLRIREQESTSSKIVTVMKEGQKAEVLGESEKWYNVKFSEFTGYVSKEYLKIDEQENENKPAVEQTNQNEVQNENSNETAAETAATEENTQEVNLVGTTITLSKNTKIRLKPTLSSSVINQLESGKQVTVSEQIGKWIKIDSNSTTGWIIYISENKEEKVETEVAEKKEEQPQVEENKTEETVEEQAAQTPEIKKGYVNDDRVNARKGASTDSDRVGLLTLNQEVEILAEEGDWYKINTSQFGECYVAKRLISLTKITSRGEETQRNSESENQNIEQTPATPVATSDKGTQIVEKAKEYLGTKYVYGGKNPSTGFDCSGYTQYIYSNFGVSLGGSASSQLGSGTTVDRSALQPGDLLIFKGSSGDAVGHVGIYIGDNQFIHAANPSRGVVIDNLDGNSYYSPRYVSAERF